MLELHSKVSERRSPPTNFFSALQKGLWFHRRRQEFSRTFKKHLCDWEGANKLLLMTSSQLGGPDRLQFYFSSAHNTLIIHDKCMKNDVRCYFTVYYTQSQQVPLFDGKTHILVLVCASLFSTKVLLSKRSCNGLWSNIFLWSDDRQYLCELLGSNCRRGMLTLEHFSPFCWFKRLSHLATPQISKN